MTGLDLLAIVLVVALTLAAIRQRRIDRHDRQRQESRQAVLNILRATGGWPT